YPDGMGTNRRRLEREEARAREATERARRRHIAHRPPPGSLAIEPDPGLVVHELRALSAVRSVTLADAGATRAAGALLAACPDAFVSPEFLAGFLAEAALVLDLTAQPDAEL